MHTYLSSSNESFGYTGLKSFLHIGVSNSSEKNFTIRKKWSKFSPLEYLWNGIYFLLLKEIALTLCHFHCLNQSTSVCFVIKNMKFCVVLGVFSYFCKDMWIECLHYVINGKLFGAFKPGRPWITCPWINQEQRKFPLRAHVGRDCKKYILEGHRRRPTRSFGVHLCNVKVC